MCENQQDQQKKLFEKYPIVKLVTSDLAADMDKVIEIKEEFLQIMPYYALTILSPGKDSKFVKEGKIKKRKKNSQEEEDKKKDKKKDAISTFIKLMLNALVCKVTNYLPARVIYSNAKKAAYAKAKGD